MKRDTPSISTVLRALSQVAKRVEKLEKQNFHDKIVLIVVVVLIFGGMFAQYYFNQPDASSPKSVVIVNREGESIARIGYNEAGDPVLSIGESEGDPSKQYVLTKDGLNSLGQDSNNSSLTGPLPANNKASGISLSSEVFDFSRMYSFSMLTDKKWDHTYDVKNRRQQATLSNPDGSVWKTFKYSYNDQDQLAGIEIADASSRFEEKWIFSYDDTGRRNDIARCDSHETVLDEWVLMPGKDGNEDTWMSIFGAGSAE